MSTNTLNDHAADVLNDLLKINNDRINGYKKAVSETDAEDLKILFGTLQSESERIANNLTKEIAKIGGIPEAGSTTNSGKIYRVWMDVKATFTGATRKAILSACEFGEDAAQSAYKTALEDEELPGDLKTLVKAQQAELKLAHNSIKTLRDIAK